MVGRRPPVRGREPADRRPTGRSIGWNPYATHWSRPPPYPTLSLFTSVATVGAARPCSNIF